MASFGEDCHDVTLEKGRKCCYLSKLAASNDFGSPEVSLGFIELTGVLGLEFDCRPSDGPELPEADGFSALSGLVFFSKMFPDSFSIVISPVVLSMIRMRSFSLDSLTWPL